MFTLVDPLGSTSYIVNPPIFFTRGTSVVHSCMITSHTYSEFRPNLWSQVSVSMNDWEVLWWCSVASRALTSHLGPMHCLAVGIMRQKCPLAEAPESRNSKRETKILPTGYCGCRSRGHELPGDTAVAARG